jgi:hypothetical protein
MAIVYQHRRKDTNDVFYIGIGKDRKRAFTRKGRNIHWKRVVDKVGYEVDVLFEGLSWEEACEVEAGMIYDYGRRDLGLGCLVNQTNGGEGTLGLKRPDVSERLSKQIGEFNHMYGKVGELHPLYGKRNPVISERIRGKKRPDLSERNSKQKGISNGRIGEAHPLWNKKGELSKVSKPLMHVESGKIYVSVTEAANSFGIRQSTMYHHIKKGKFKYIENEKR